MHYLRRAPDSQPIGYLAQHQLFEQISELLDDVLVPDYCMIPTSYPEDADAGAGSGSTSASGGGPPPPLDAQSLAARGEPSTEGHAADGSSAVVASTEPSTELLSSDADSRVTMNAWFGPPHTVSPMHQDPKHNILAQVLLCTIIVHPKYIVLYYQCILYQFKIFCLYLLLYS